MYFQTETDTYGRAKTRDIFENGLISAWSVILKCKLGFVVACSMNPGDSKAMEGIQNVERANGGEAEHDSGEEAEETNGEGISLEEVSKGVFTSGRLPFLCEMKRLQKPLFVAV